MRCLVVVLLCYIYLAESKTNTKSLTESMGQEVIEIGAPVKDLPADLDEEPSVENEDSTSTTIQVATKKDTRRILETVNKRKDVDDIDKQDDEETRIEKELAEMYKDSSDYTSDSSEVKEKLNSTEVSTIYTDNSTNFEEKPVARVRANFQFQPNANNPKEIEKFRTSVDEINCERNKLTATTYSPNAAIRAAINTSFLYLITLLTN
ncbi:unnamed protein product [Leptosia nina]|uniref:Uncharacterized protein n=1 Tax=Leptosia nina TaxID=320188 RepID=A0AAV1JGX8_9NEOP